MLATARLLGQTAGAVAVGAAFHLAGVRVAPSLLLAAAIAALVAAGISLLRLARRAAGARVYRPDPRLASITRWPLSQSTNGCRPLAPGR